MRLARILLHVSMILFLVLRSWFFLVLLKILLRLLMVFLNWLLVVLGLLWVLLVLDWVSFLLVLRLLHFEGRRVRAVACLCLLE